jgi:regulator of replication initiation timing
MTDAGLEELIRTLEAVHDDNKILISEKEALKKRLSDAMEEHAMLQRALMQSREECVADAMWRSDASERHHGGQK